MSGGDLVRSSGRLRTLAKVLRRPNAQVLAAAALRSAAPFTRAADGVLAALRREASPFSEEVRCAFLVGPPRCGSTMVYQSLVATLPCIYMSNYHALFPRLGSSLLRRAGLAKEGWELRNCYGYAAGLKGVYEGNEYLDWLHSGTADCDAADARTVRARFMGLLNLLQPKPDESVILKNARSCFSVSRLHRAAPEIVFVRIRRDTEAVVQSAVRAWREIGSFHPVPPSLRTTPIDDPVSFAVAQITGIEVELDRQFGALPKRCQIETDYESFCNRPYDFIECLATEYLGFKSQDVHRFDGLDSLQPSRTRKVSAEEAVRIRQLLSRAKSKSLETGR